MPVLKWIVAVALAVGIPASVMAQDQAPLPAPGTTTTTVKTDTTLDTPSPGQWMVSGFVGSNFGASATDPSVDFGGQVGYLYRGAIGAEFLADFAPKFKINNALLADNPTVNSYMVNAIGAIPIGFETRFQPYVSGGVGGIQLRSDVLNLAGAPSLGTTSANQTRFGGDLGAGIMGFAGNIGIRGDVRYYRAFTSDSLSTNASDPANAFAKNLLSGLDFWRANIGIAVRW